MKARFIKGNQFVEYEIDEGSVIIENYNETLDSATIRISHLTEELDIEVEDSCVLIDDRSMNPSKKLKDRYMIVDTWKSTEYGLYDVKTYSYEISLSSPTKLLEGIILPNLSITNTVHSNSILYYINMYLYLYGPRVRRYVSGNLVLDHRWHISNDLINDSRFNKKCPEMQWNMPTLREVLTDLMMVVDCIPILKRDDKNDLDVANEISFLDLTKKNQRITNYNYITKTQSLSDYVSELQMQMQNVMQTTVDDVKNTTLTTEFLTLKTDSYVITEDQEYYLETEYPILAIKHLYMWIFPPEVVENSENCEPQRYDLLDIRAYLGDGGGSLVYEKQAYDKLGILYRTPTVDINNSVENYYSKYSSFCIYYSRGSNRILGFSKTNKGYPLVPDKSTLALIKEIAFLYYISIRGITSMIPRDINNGNNSYFSTLFEIEYYTTSELMYRAGKSIRPKNNRIVVDHQTNSYVDSYNQGNLEYQKANRLGNKAMNINQRIDNEEFNSLIKIGDYLDDNIVYQTQYQIYENHIETNAQATKNYILKDYFTGIKAKVRTWSNAREEAFIRHDLKKYYVELSFKKAVSSTSTSCSSASFTYCLTNPATEDPIAYCGVKTDKTNNTYYSLNLNSRVVGNSLVFTFGFNDNYFISKYVDTEIDDTSIENAHYDEYTKRSFHLKATSTTDYGGVPQQYYSYTDDNGEFTTITYSLCRDILNTRFTSPSTPSDYKEKFIKSCRRPLVDYNDLSEIDIEDSVILYKDNREIPRLSVQYEICTQNEDIYFTKRFVLAQTKVRTSNLIQYKLYYAANSSYNINSEVLPTSAVEISGTTLTRTTYLPNSHKVNIALNGTYNLKGYSYYITDQDGNILIGIRYLKGDTQTTNIYFYCNVLEIRDTNIYDNEEKIIGTIEED